MVQGACEVISDADIISAYGRHRSVWKAGVELGICGQNVHQRLVKLGLNAPKNLWTEADDAILLEEYTAFVDTGRLGDLAKRLGRTKQFVVRQAGRLGLTNQSRSKPYLFEAMSKRTKEQMRVHGHPRGMLGKKHTTEAVDAMRRASKERWDAMTPKQQRDLNLKQLKTRLAKYGTLAPPREGTTWKSAWREIGGRKRYFRSRWEANYARYLNWLEQLGEIKLWEHEPETFWFEKVRRGTRSYLPDFRVTEKSGAIVYHEVKGWMDDRSKTKLKRMKKYHPTVRLVLIQAREYHAISAKVSRLIDGWE